MTEWSTAQIALVLSGISLLVSLASFFWNVWSKFIYPKPKIQVWVDIRYVNELNAHSASIRKNGQFAADYPVEVMVMPHLALSVTNCGPGRSTITLPCMRLARFHQRRKEGHASIIAYENFPTDLSANSIQSGGLPKELEEGENFELVFPVEDRWFVKSTMSSIGIRDSLSRLHWASPKNMIRLRQQYRSHLNHAKSVK